MLRPSPLPPLPAITSLKKKSTSERSYNVLLSILFIYFFHEREHGRSDWLDDRRYEKSIILSSRLILFYGDYLSYRAIDTIQGERGEDRFLADKVNVENVEKYLFALDFVFEAIVLSRVYVRALDYISRWENYSTPRDNENIKRVKISRNLSTF